MFIDEFQQVCAENHPHPVAENVRARDFDPDEPNAAWGAAERKRLLAPEAGE